MKRLYSTSIKQVSKQTATGKCAHSITLFDRGTRFPKLSQLSWTVVIQTQDDPSLHADKLVHQRWFARIGNAKHSNLPAAINLLDVYGLHQCINICWQMPAENVSPSFSTGLGVFFHRLNGSFIDLQNASKGYKTLSLWVQVPTEYLQGTCKESMIKNTPCPCSLPHSADFLAIEALRPAGRVMKWSPNLLVTGI